MIVIFLISYSHLLRKMLSSVNFSEDDILSEIKKLDPSKTQGHNIIKIRMLKLCGKTICKSLYTSFTPCTETGVFSLNWKIANVVPIHKKKCKLHVHNYKPVSLIPVCEKFFERLVYSKMILTLPYFT